MTRLYLYRDWVRAEAELIHADGCTGVTNAYGFCCLQHDLEFFYGKSATDAYRLYLAGVAAYWVEAQAVTFDEANKHLKSCHFRESKLGYWNPVAWARYGAMRLKKTRAAWDGHRQREQEAV